MVRSRGLSFLMMANLLCSTMTVSTRRVVSSHSMERNFFATAK
jgi:hypothetical protein